MARKRHTLRELENYIIGKHDNIQWLLSELGYVYELSLEQRRVHHYDCVYMRTHRNVISEYVHNERAEWVGLRARVNPKHVQQTLDEIGWIVELRENLGWHTEIGYTPTHLDKWHERQVEKSITLVRVSEVQRARAA